MIEVRDATAADAPAIAAIYAPFVRDTAISFERMPPDADEIADRISTTQAEFPYLVAADGAQVMAYAYARRFRPRAAYARTAEVTAYTAPASQRRGAARALYAGLLDRLRALGMKSAMAVITLPNAASVGLHERFGFQHRGTLVSAGWKFDRWHDIGLWQYMLEGAADG